jgi:hypothetical protein
MSVINPLLSNTLNQIHQWSEPGQNPMKRMFLTRLAEIGCAGIEASTLAFKTIELSALSAKHLMHAPTDEMRTKANEVANLLKGLTSTLIFGVFFSPEANFKMHLKLKLAVDNRAEKSQRELAAKLQAELQKAEITKIRNERFAKLEAEEQAIKEAKNQADVVNSRLAELLG